MARFRRIAGLAAAMRRCDRTESDIGEARAWYLRDALRRYARAVPALARLAEGLVG